MGKLRGAVPLGVWLALASATILAVFLIGNSLAQRSTRVTTENASRMEHRYEPLVRLSRDLEYAIGAFDRAVLGGSGVDEAARQLLVTLAEYQSIVVAENPLRGQIAAFHRDGLLLLERQKERPVAVTAYWSAMKAAITTTASRPTSGTTPSPCSAPSRWPTRTARSSSTGLIPSRGR